MLKTALRFLRSPRRVIVVVLSMILATLAYQHNNVWLAMAPASFWLSIMSLWPVFAETMAAATAAEQQRIGDKFSRDYYSDPATMLRGVSAALLIIAVPIFLLIGLCTL